MLEVLIGSDLSSIAESPEIMEQAPIKYVEHQMRELAGTVEPLMDAAQRAALDQFATWLLDKKKEFGTLTIVSTNYDVTVESELFVQKQREPKECDFGFDWRNPFGEALIPRPATPDLAFYKLHGSFNWLRCDLCGQLYINPYELIAYLSFREAQQWANTCTCGAYPLRHVIVAPSMVRDVRDPHLLNIWRCATEALRTAKKWFIIGYSLPAEDLAIRSMLLRAYNARGLDDQSASLLPQQTIRPGPDVTVVQMGNTTKPAYEAMFPQGSFEFLEGGLEELLGGCKRSS
jgi:NAD-dependent SIR2 family protein deacetylase